MFIMMRSEKREGGGCGRCRSGDWRPGHSLPSSSPDFRAGGRAMSETGTGKTDFQAEYARLKTEFDSLTEANNALNERVLELYTLYNISRTLSMSLQVNELFELTMNLLNQSLELDQYCLMLLDEKSGKLI